MRPEDRRSLSDLLAAALTQLSLLVQMEIRLARAEIGQKLAAVGVGIGLIAFATVLVIPAFALLLMGFAAWLTQYGLSTAVADAIAGAAALIIAALLLVVGLNRLRVDALKPRRTLAQLQRDATVAKEHLI